VWLNLHACAALDTIKSTWYTEIHGLIPTNDRLAAINLTATGACLSCGHTNSLQHRMTGCGEGPIIWTWTKNVLGVILRMDHRYIPQDSTQHPAMQHWLAQKQPAILWILARLVHYRLQTHRHLSFLDYMDFLWRTRWKLYHQAQRPLVTGRYLDVLDWPQP
jgi:hypothetical protein